MFRTALDLALPVALATLLIAAAVGAGLADPPARGPAPAAVTAAPAR
jgi:hypothetical protein